MIIIALSLLTKKINMKVEKELIQDLFREMRENNRLKKYNFDWNYGKIDHVGLSF
jgi:hypothetical protein